MKKISVLLNGALALFSLPVLVFASSCSAQTWKTNIQAILSPVSTIADHAFNENSFMGISEFFKNTVYKSDKNWVGPDPNMLIDKTSGVWRSSAGYTNAEFIDAYRDAYVSGAKILVCNGFEQADPLQTMNSDTESQIQQLPDYVKKLRDEIGLIYVDGQLDGKISNPYDVASIAYKIDDAAFWGGVLTGIELNENSYYTPIDDDKTYGDYEGKAYLAGGFVGLPIPPTLAFLSGWCQGLNYFNSKLDTWNSDTNHKEYNPVIFISPERNNKFDKVNYFSSGSFSPSEERARTITDSYLDKNVSAILPIAGPQTAIAVKEIAQRKSNTMVVGVDTSLEANKAVNMWNGDQPIISFSIIKNLTQSVMDVLNSINDKLLNPQAISSSYKGFGYNNFATWENGGVGLSYKNFDNGKLVDTEYLKVLNTYLGNTNLDKKLTMPYGLKGDDFNRACTAKVTTKVNNKTVIQTVTTVPALGSGKAIYFSGSGEAEIVATEADIATFLTNFANKNKVTEGGSEKINWYMQRY